MTTEISHILTGDSSRLLKAYDDLIARQEKQQKKARETAESNKKLREERDRTTAVEKRLAAAERESNKEKERAARLIREVETPLERLNRQKRELVQLHGKEGVTQDILLRKYKQLNAEYRKSTQLQRSFTSTDFSGAVRSVTGLVTGYVSLQGAIGLASKTLEDQIALQEQSLSIVRDIGAAQQEAIKNLTGLTTAQKQDTIAAAEDIRGRTGFPDEAQIANAIGAGFSASGDLVATKLAAEASAKLTLNRPEGIVSVTAGALDLARGTGLKDAERNIGLLLSAGSTARVEDPVKLAVALGPALTEGVNTAIGQNRVEAARESAALFGVLTRGGTDKKGESSTTATIVLLEKISDLFRNLPESAESIKEDINKLLAKKPITPREQLQIEQAQFALEQTNKEIKELGKATSPEQKLELRQLQLERRDRQLDLQKAKDSATLTAEEEKELASLKGSLKQLNVQDPGSIFGRIRAIQQNPALREELFSKNFGEARFQAVFRQIFDAGGDVANELLRNKNTIRASSDVFNQNVDEIQRLTPTIAAATQARKIEGTIQQIEKDPLLALNASIRDLRTKTLQATNAEGVAGIISNAQLAAGLGRRFDTGNLAPLSSRDPITIARATFADFQTRRQTILEGSARNLPGDQRASLTPDEALRLQKIATATDSLIQSLEVATQTLNGLTEQQKQEAEVLIESIREEGKSAAARIQAAGVNQ